MNTSLNYYEILGVSKTATEDEIRKAYKAQMKVWHPDLNKSKDASEMSKKINEAKEVLLNPEKRKQYDISLDENLNQTYKKYTEPNNYYNSTQNSSNESTKPKQNKEQYVTKWKYLSDYLDHANVPNYRKFFALIGVLLESLLCLILKVLIICFSYFIFYLSVFIKYTFNYLISIFGLLLLLLVFLLFTNGLQKTIKEYGNLITIVSASIIIYLSSYLLPILANKILSPKTFDILYNKIDITLFKLCVGYKQKN